MKQLKEIKSDGKGRVRICHFKAHSRYNYDGYSVNYSGILSKLASIYLFYDLLHCK